MTIKSAHKLDVGRRREQNEDYVWVDEQTGVYILADGMGGHEAGDVASQLAATTVGQLVVTQLQAEMASLTPAKIKELLTTAIETANETVLNAAQEAGQHRGMGTTIVIAVLHGSTIYISHIGDSRAYLAHNSTLQQLTEDDTWGAQLAKAGEAGSGQSYLTHILTQAVGQDSSLEPSFTTIDVKPDDWLLLCSDGLWNMVQDEETLEKLHQAQDNPMQAVEALVEAANEAGGKDNISVIAVKIIEPTYQPDSDTPSVSPP